MVENLKKSCSEFGQDESIYSFVKENLHTNAEILNFFAGDWVNYIPQNTTPRQSFDKIVQFFFDACDKRDPLLTKLLTPSNVEKILNGKSKKTASDESLGLSSPGFVYDEYDSYGEATPMGLLANDFRDVDFSKFNLKDPYDKRVYDFLVKAVSNQMVKLVFAPNFDDFQLKGKFAADVLIDMEMRSTGKFEEGSDNALKSRVMIDYYVQEVVKVCKLDDDPFYKYLDVSFLSREANGNNWTGNYSQLIGEKCVVGILFAVNEKEALDKVPCVLDTFKYLNNKKIFADMFFSKSDEVLNFRDLVVSMALPTTVSNTSQTSVWSAMEKVLNYVNKEFSYLNTYVPSIKRFNHDLNGTKLSEGSSFIPERVEKIMNFYKEDVFFNVLKKEDVIHPVINKKLLDINFKELEKQNLSNTYEDSLSVSGFKL